MASREKAGIVKNEDENGIIVLHWSDSRETYR